MRRVVHILIAVFILLFIQCEKIDHSRIALVLTEAIGSITSSNAVAQGYLVDLGDEGISEHGHCWSTQENPTITDSRTTLGAKSNTGTFESSLTGLNAATTYHIRAYARTGESVIYGEDEVFTTLTGSSANPEAPNVTTSNPTQVMRLSATCGGNVTSDGGSEIVSRGVCWNTDGDPVPGTDQSMTTDPGTGSFTCLIYGLDELTDYHVRAFAENSDGMIGYGEDIVFTTTTYASVMTSDVSYVTSDRAACGGTVTYDGGTPILERGICVGFNNSPTVDISEYSFGEPGSASFSYFAYNLDMATLYYHRAYATNINGTSYGAPVSFITKLEDSRDETEYAVVKIGNQYWMAQNLNYGETVTISIGQSDNGTIEKYCWNGYTSDCGTYAGIYTWHEMMQYSTTESVQGVCPSGWHIPSDDEWKELETSLGMTQEQADIDNDWRGTNEGAKLKITGTTWWNEPNEATNSSGFSAMPAGYSSQGDQSFYGIGDFTTFWTSTSHDSNYAIYRELYNDETRVYRTSGGYKENGTPVRCVKD